METKKLKYLDPKNDLTFRKIFGEHPHLLISFLNEVLPLEQGQLIEHIDYLDPEIIPELPGLKRSIVDVHCTDNQQRYFIVEMQMYWTSSFKNRMLFNSGKAYVRQLKGGGKYSDLKPVYGLSLIDDIFHTSKEMKDIYYHHYRIVHKQNSDEQIKGLELIFIELPKFRAKKFSDKRLQTLWLRFLTEIDENTQVAPDDLMNDSLIKEALEYVQKDAFTEEELLYYDQYWDAIRVEKAAIEDITAQKEEAERRAFEAQRENADAQREKAEAQQREADAQREKAEAQQREADAQREKAEAQQREADAQREKAEAQQREAEAQREKAEAQQREAKAQQREAEAQQKLINTVKKLHNKGMNNEDIAELTGETFETIHYIISM